MRLAVVLVLALACKDKPASEAPKPGSAVAATKRPSGPFDPAKLSQHDVAGWTRDVRQADSRGVEVRYRADAIVVTVQIAKCFDCLPMQLDRWQAKSDALRSLIPPELRDQATTTWEHGMTDFADSRAFWTFYAGRSPALTGTAYTLYWNDGAHMIRVAAEYHGDGSRQVEVTKSRLEAAARVFLDELTRRWG